MKIFNRDSCRSSNVIIIINYLLVSIPCNEWIDERGKIDRIDRFTRGSKACEERARDRANKVFVRANIHKGGWGGGGGLKTH